MWTMWSVLCVANPDSQTESKIYGVYTSLKQALKSIKGTDGSFEYEIAYGEDEVVAIGTSKTDPPFKVKYIIKEFQVDV